MPRRLGLFLVATLGGTSFASSSFAVTQVRYEAWGVENTAIAVDTTSPLDSVTAAGVSFEATSSAGDLAGGFRFAIAEKDPDGNDALLQFRVAPCNPYPPAGTSITVHASFALYCDAAGRLQASKIVRWALYWCDYPVPGACFSEGTTFATFSGDSEPEDFELVVLDENDQEGTVPTPEDLLHTHASGPGQPFHLPNPDLPPSGVVGLYADPAGTLCSTTVQPLVPFRWYVVAHLEGLLRCGFTLFTFLVQGLPQGVYYNLTAHPAVHALLGSLFEGGIGIGFRCERGTDDRIVLLTIDGISDRSLQDVVLSTVTATLNNPNPFSQYPWADSCPLGMPDRRELIGSKFYVNPSSAPGCDPTVAVRETSWERLKALYR